MSKLSEKKKQRISEQILSVLFDKFPNPLFTSQIANEIIRDHEFTKSLLEELKNKNLIISIHKNSLGDNYLKRTRWRLSNKTHQAYSQNYK